MNDHVGVDLKAECLTITVNARAQSFKRRRVHRLSRFFFEDGLKISRRYIGLESAAERIELFSVIGDVRPVVV